MSSFPLTCVHSLSFYQWMIRSYLSIYFAGLADPGSCILMSRLRATPGRPADAAGWPHTDLITRTRYFTRNTYISLDISKYLPGTTSWHRIFWDCWAWLRCSSTKVPLTCEPQLTPETLSACPKGQLLHLILSCYSSLKFHVGSRASSHPDGVFNLVLSPNSVSMVLLPRAIPWNLAEDSVRSNLWGVLQVTSS